MISLCDGRARRDHFGRAGSPRYRQRLLRFIRDYARRHAKAERRDATSSRRRLLYETRS